MPRLVFATRPSKLARWQTGYVMGLLEDAWRDLHCDEVVITTKGDRILDKPIPEIGGKGLFTSELEEALHAGEVHAAVHSLKDLPTENPPGLTIAAIPERAPANDVLVCPRGFRLENLPQAAIVGTSSLRRQAQLLAHRPDLKTRPIRGNVDTRIRKVTENQYDAVILAAAGLIRLGLKRHITEIIPPNIIMPAPGQGALAIQCRTDDEETINLLAPIADTAATRATTAEREFLGALGGGCSIPVGAYAQAEDDEILLQAVVASADGELVLHLEGRGKEPAELGNRLAQEALAQKADEVIHAISG